MPVVNTSAAWTLALAVAGGKPRLSITVVAGQAVGHADGTVNELRREADRDEENEVVPHWQPLSALGLSRPATARAISSLVPGP